MRRLCTLATLGVVLLLGAPLASASHSFFHLGSGFDDDDSFFGSSPFGSRSRDRDDDDDRRSSRSDNLIVELDDGRRVRVDEGAYDLLVAQTGGAPTDDQILGIADLEQCILERNGRIISRDCDRVERVEDRIQDRARVGTRDRDRDRDPWDDFFRRAFTLGF